MTLNQAIIKVISTQYKKDAKDAHQIVEDAGYTIEKHNGCYRVVNPKLHRYCYMERSNYYYEEGFRWTLYWGSMGWGSKTFFGNPEDLKFDYEHMLNTPYNHAACTSAYEDKWNKSAAMEKYIYLKDLKYYVRKSEEETKSILNSIEQLQQRLINITEVKVKNVTKLNEYRKQCGLKEEK